MARKTAVAPEEPDDRGKDDVYHPDADDETVKIGPDPRECFQMMAGDLYVDKNTQRDANHQRVDLVRWHWNWYMSEVPTVAPMGGGKYRVIEGQHRVLALQRADPTILTWVVVLPESVTMKEQAKLGHDISKGRLLHNPLELWNQRLKVGEPHEVLTDTALARLGLHLGRGKGPATIRCVYAVNRIVHGGGHTPEYGSQLMADTAEVILQAFPKYDPQSTINRWDELIVKVVAAFLDKFPDIDRTRLVLKLGARPAKAWRTAAQAQAGPNSSFDLLRGYVLAAYNSGLRSGRLEW